MLTETDIQKARFAPSDAVQFRYDHRNLIGKLKRMNPKRAVVRCADGEYSVPYERLMPVGGNRDTRVTRIRQIHDLALDLMNRHGIGHWAFGYDHSTRRAGCCSYHDKRITISFNLACNASDADVRDTILHEIAHALAGKKHNHDAVWKAKAREIGCSGERCHRLRFSPPRYTVTCENRCWTHTAERRNARLICRNCGGKLLYSTYPATGEPAAGIG